VVVAGFESRDCWLSADIRSEVRGRWTEATLQSLVLDSIHGIISPEPVGQDKWMRRGREIMNTNNKKFTLASVAIASMGILWLISGILGLFTQDPRRVHGDFYTTAQEGAATSQCLIEAVLGILAIGVGAYLIYWNNSD
jgi:hypothetical protein